MTHPQDYGPGENPRRGAYGVGIQIIGLPLFLLVWAFAIIEYGWLGVLLGWFPAAFIGLVGGMLWPVVVLGGVVVAIVFAALT